MKITFGSSLPANNTVFTIFIPLHEGYDEVKLGTLLSSYKISGVKEILKSLKGKKGESKLFYSDLENISGVVTQGIGKTDFVSNAKALFTKLGAQNKSTTGENIASI